MNAPLLEVVDVTVRYRLRHGGRTVTLDALRGVSLVVRAGESLGVVGESGSGKSTVARAALGLVPAHGGCVRWRGQSLASLSPRRLRVLRRDFQLVFQDPAGSLNPRWPVLLSVREPLDVHETRQPAALRDEQAVAMLGRVGLDGLRARYPHELSGGQCQRAAIARAMVARPALLVCDEALSALDVSVQRQVMDLLSSLRAETGVACVFISHNLAVVRHLCTRVVVMYLGRIVEAGPVEAVFGAPLHPYTRALLDAVPTLDPARERARRPAPTAEGPSPIAPPRGCAFSGRCPRAAARCHEERPGSSRAPDGREVSCHRAWEWPEGLQSALPA